MKQEIAANLGTANCVVTKLHFGHDTWMNVCTGQHVEIAWAFGDWAAFAALALIALMLVTVLVGLISTMWNSPF